MDIKHKVFLKWDSFPENITSSYVNLRYEGDFTDITLVSEDGEMLKLHKIILAASSPFFQNVCSNYQNISPLIYMKGYKAKHLTSIIDFIYFGETSVYQENLEMFLVLAKNLDIKGIAEEDHENTRKTTMEDKCMQPIINIDQENIRNMQVENEFKSTFQTMELITVQKKTYPIVSDSSLFLEYSESEKPQETNSELSQRVQAERLDEIDLKVSDMIERIHTNKCYKCKACGKIVPYKNKTYLRRHIESKHLKPQSFACDMCGKTFKLSQYFLSHKREHTKGETH